MFDFYTLAGFMFGLSLRWGMKLNTWFPSCSTNTKHRVSGQIRNANHLNFSIAGLGRSISGIFQFLVFWIKLILKSNTPTHTQWFRPSMGDHVLLGSSADLILISTSASWGSQVSTAKSWMDVTNTTSSFSRMSLSAMIAILIGEQ